MTRTLAVALILLSMILGTPCGAEPAKCSVDAIQKLATADVEIATATPVEAETGKPAHCSVSGIIRTTDDASPPQVPAGHARFRLELPEVWTNRFVMFGVGGFGGSLEPSANPTDVDAALPEGYAVAINDAGHISTPGILVDGSFAMKPDGTANSAALTDYFWRATHRSTVLLQKLVEAYYGQAIKAAYFDGCSNGGRQGLMEAERFPDDYDGIIAGAPFLDLRLMLGDIKVQKANLAGRLSPKDLGLIDRYVVKQCDAEDGARDGIIQNPKRCKLDFDALLCKGADQNDCLTDGQIATLNAYLADTVGQDGTVIYRGFAPGNLLNSGAAFFQFGVDAQPTPKPGKSWPEHKGPLEYEFDLEALRYLILHRKTASILDYPVGLTGIVDPETLGKYDRAVSAGNANNVEALRAYLDSGRKLILYHGYSDPAISPYGTVDFFEALAHPGSRLFMVPEMGHCGGGGVPDRFDTLLALQHWVEQGKAPEAMTARTEEGTGKTMLICPYPKEARQITGEIGDGAHWMCVAPAATER